MVIVLHENYFAATLIQKLNYSFVVSGYVLALAWQNC